MNTLDLYRKFGLEGCMIDDRFWAVDVANSELRNEEELILEEQLTVRLGKFIPVFLISLAIWIGIIAFVWKVIF